MTPLLFLLLLLLWLAEGQTSVSNVYTVNWQPGPTSASVSTVVAYPSAVLDNGWSTSLITVTALDSNGNPEAGKTVSLASNRSSLDTVSAPSGSSTSAGVVTFTVKSYTPGVAQFTATDSTDGVVLSFATVTFTSVSTSGSQVRVVNASSAVANGLAPILVAVTLIDVNGNVVPGKSVSLASNRGASDTISPSSAVTNALGVANFSVVSQVAGSSTWTATDTSDTLVVAQTASGSFYAGAVSLSVSGASTSSGSVSAGASVTVYASVLDAYSNPVASQLVTLSSSRLGDSVGTASGVSSAQGVVSFTVSATLAGSSVYTARLGGASFTGSTAAVVYVAGPVSLTASTITGSTLTPTAGVTTLTLTVTCVDQFLNPIGGRAVTVTSPRASDTITGPSPALTPSSTGAVQFTVTSPVAGPDAFTATVS